MGPAVVEPGEPGVLLPNLLWTFLLLFFLKVIDIRARTRKRPDLIYDTTFGTLSGLNVGGVGTNHSYRHVLLILYIISFGSLCMGKPR